MRHVLFETVANGFADARGGQGVFHFQEARDGGKRSVRVLVEDGQNVSL
jgi:hypothetical protein